MPYNLIILSLYFVLITLSVIGYGLILNRFIGEKKLPINLQNWLSRLTRLFFY